LWVGEKCKCQVGGNLPTVQTQKALESNTSSFCKHHPVYVFASHTHTPVHTHTPARTHKRKSNSEFEVPKQHCTFYLFVVPCAILYYHALPGCLHIQFSLI